MVNTTTDPEPFVSKIRDLKPGGGAALYDAIYMACTNRALIKGEPFEPRRVLIVIGDGNDNSSNKTLQEVLEVAQRNLVTIYGISTTAYGFTSVGSDNLISWPRKPEAASNIPCKTFIRTCPGFQSTPSDEGNLAFHAAPADSPPPSPRRCFIAVANVAGEITTQYILRYIPDDPASARTRSFRGH